MLLFLFFSSFFFSFFFQKKIFPQIDNAFRTSREFFDLPYEAKKQYSRTSNQENNGYVELQQERLVKAGWYAAVLLYLSTVNNEETSFTLLATKEYKF